MVNVLPPTPIWSLQVPLRTSSYSGSSDSPRLRNFKLDRDQKNIALASHWGRVINAVDGHRDDKNEYISSTDRIRQLEYPYTNKMTSLILTSKFDRNSRFWPLQTAHGLKTNLSQHLVLPWPIHVKSISRGWKTWEDWIGDAEEDVMGCLICPQNRPSTQICFHLCYSLYCWKIQGQCSD